MSRLSTTQPASRVRVGVVWSRPVGHRVPARPTGGRSRLGKVGWSLALGSLAAWGLACDGSSRALDASAAPSARMSALSLRIDVAPQKQPTLTILGFRAAFSGVSASDVMALVDPLGDTGPGRDCAMRDINDAAATLASGDHGIELEEFGGAAISVGEVIPPIRLSPRLFPDVAPSIGGVVSEAGPLALGAWPEQLRVTGDTAVDGTTVAVSVPVPTAGQIMAINGEVPSPSDAIPVAGELNLGLVAVGTGDSSIELRPLGATVALICHVPADAVHAGASSFVISHQLLAGLIAATGAAPGRSVVASLDLVRRINGHYASADSRIAVEVRAATLVELAP